ncbi:MAG TPA: aminoacyl-tRNA hydrolase [Burkholderiales bacterium]|nr:aminoacyl-tRNA hydrolase [Burkholderiales bacterium]
MKLIVGLGNPGDKYQATRHNAGFWLVERFAAQTHTVLRKDAKFQALVGRHAASGVWLMLPQSYMNSSGRAVQMLASFFKIAPAEILVVHDELDFPPGVARLKHGGGVAGHNGLKDISARLGSHDYWRLRIGIGHPGERHAVTDYVLHKPSQEERAAIEAAIEHALEVLPLVLAGDMQGAMLKLHSAPQPAPARPQPAPAGEAGPDRKTAEPAAASAQAERPVEPAAHAAAVAEVKPEGKRGLGAFLKKLLPEGGPARRK